MHVPRHAICAEEGVQETLQHEMLTVDKGPPTYCPGCGHIYYMILFHPGETIDCYRCGMEIAAPLLEAMVEIRLT